MIFLHKGFLKQAGKIRSKKSVQFFGNNKFCGSLLQHKTVTIFLTKNYKKRFAAVSRRKHFVVHLGFK